MSGEGRIKERVTEKERQIHPHSLYPRLFLLCSSILIKLRVTSLSQLSPSRPTSPTDPLTNNTTTENFAPQLCLASLSFEWTLAHTYVYAGENRMHAHECERGKVRWQWFSCSHCFSLVWLNKIGLVGVESWSLRWFCNIFSHGFRDSYSPLSIISVLSLVTLNLIPRTVRVNECGWECESSVKNKQAYELNRRGVGNGPMQTLTLVATQT